MKIVWMSLFFGMMTESVTWWGFGYLLTRFSMFASSDLLHLLYSILHSPLDFVSKFISLGPPYGLLVPLIAEAILWSLFWGVIFFLVESDKKARKMNVN